MSGNFTEMFRREHPDLSPVEGDPQERVLLWAKRKRYIRLVKFERVHYYTQQQLETALMWQQKIEEGVTEER